MYLKLATTVEPQIEIDQFSSDAGEVSDQRFYHPLHAGRHLFHEGDEAENVYEVERGMLRLARVMENGRRQIVAFALPGDVVGFPEGNLHHTDCDAITDCVVLAHRRSALDRCNPNPELHRRLTRAALHEICAMQDHFMMLSSKSAAEKIASFVLTLAERIGEPATDGIHVDIPMRRVDIADFLGLTTETVCRTFTQFRKAGLITLETAQKAVVRDLEGLRARAEPE
ncbi:helix-turn-helix domain-containing protein [Rhodobacteraceae bacterium N5(2021)]|uniref:Helix-turn-helix domain-containing protein n=1 Tax=Gymnodinialimonas phycosphaerae TaxID=2841589 RepID=A0A975TRW9_9RHOB|nr:helix-turn-helix domain-containing protein [Gymnodinialimonas phycosphaerae]MBY4893870.1 helix-turn-helix domain-containing protein [Gymnodinialimonas phycosphaerae]